MEEQNLKTAPVGKIIQTGVLGAMLSFIGMFLPGFILLMILLPLPYISLIYKHGHKAGTTAILITSIINLLIFGPQMFLYSLVTFGLIAVLVGGAFHEKYSPSRTALISVGATLISGMVLYWIGTQMELLEHIRSTIEQSPIWEQFAAIYPPESKEQIIDHALMVIPGMFANISLGLGMILYYFSARFLRKLGNDIPRLKPWKDWSYPKGLAVLFLLLRFLSVNSVIVNIMLVVWLILVVEGLSTVLFYSGKWGVYPWVRVFLVLLLIVFSDILLWLGVIDNLFRLRRVKNQDQG